MQPPENLLDHQAISGCYLFPQSRFVRSPWMVSVDGAELACYRNIIDPACETLVHFHGNGEAVADYIPWMADKLADLNLNSLFVEYREYGESTGEAKLVAMLPDGEAVIKAAGLAPEKVIAFGRSIGSLYAIELAHRLPNIAGLVLESGIADPSERFLAYANLTALGVAEREVVAAARLVFDHKSKLEGYHNPLLVLHAEHDMLVEKSHAERNYRWAASSEKWLEIFPVGDHNSIMSRNRDAYFATLNEFVKLIVRGQSTQ